MFLKLFITLLNVVLLVSLFFLIVVDLHLLYTYKYVFFSISLFIFLLSLFSLFLCNINNINSNTIVSFE